MPSVRFGETVQLSLTVVDNLVPENNPVIGIECWVAIRDMLTDMWWNFETEMWEAVIFDGSKDGGLEPLEDVPLYNLMTGDHKMTLVDEGDGTYGYAWDHSLTGYNGPTPAWYLMHYQIDSEGSYVRQVATEVWSFRDDPNAAGPGDLAAQVMVVDELSNPVDGASVSIWNDEQTVRVAYGTTNPDGKVVFALNAGSYKAIVGTQGRFVSNNPYSYVFDGSSTWTEFEVETLVITLPDAPEYCRLYAHMYGVGGALLGAGEGRLLVSQVYRRPDGFEGFITPNGGDGVTDERGYVYVDVARGAIVNVVVSWGDSRGEQDHARIEVPDLPLLNIGPMIRNPGSP
jgi:hypothetical protein